MDRSISQEELDRLDQLVQEDPRAAFVLILSYEQRYSKDPNFIQNGGACLVDIGTLLDVPGLVQLGIDWMQSLLPSDLDNADSSLLYNIANGYYSLDALERRLSTFKFDPDTTPLLEAKRWYRKLLERGNAVPPRLRTQMRVNYGNCLSHLCRSVEAISQYDLAISDDSSHPMAWGNLGIELLYFAGIIGRSNLFFDARTALRQALVDNELEKRGEGHARPYFERDLRRVEDMIGDHKEDRTPHPQRTQNSEYQKRYTQFCLSRLLFLNFSLPNFPTEHPAEDSLGFSIVTPINDQATFTRLARVANEVKESYTTARMLLFEVFDHPYRLEAFDDMTDYVDNLDYAVYGIAVGKLKLAFQAAFNILDRIAILLNDYLKLGVTERQVSFTTIWREKNSVSIRPTLLALDNRHLFALYDLSRDFASKGHFGYLRRTRDYLTHRYLVPHEFGMVLMTDVDGDDYHLAYEDFKAQTLQVIQHARSAVIYLIAAIGEEERKKHVGMSGLCPPIMVPRYEAHPTD